LKLQWLPARKLLDVMRVIATRRFVLDFDKIEFAFDNLSYRRIWNWLLAELSYHLKTDRALAYPTHLQIDPSSACNLKCPMCHRTTHDLPSGLLEPDHFRQVIDEVGDRIMFLHFWGWGEPLTNANIYTMIRYAVDRGIKVVTSSNGHRLAEPRNVERLLDSGLDALIIALDGTDPETYTKYRQNGDFHRVLRGVRLLARRKLERGCTAPVVNLRMVVRRDNEHQIEEMKRLARELDVDLLTLKTFYIHDSGEDPADYLPRDHAYRRFEYDAHGRPVRKENRCKRPWNHPTIYNDGTVTLCDYFTQEELPLGNVFADDGPSFREIWFGSRYRGLRARFAAGEPRGMRCDDCALNYVGPEGYVSHAFRLRDG
jgi:MoaA/NifB/PqqE/SkfB family radical SAM enzyme